MWWSLFDVCTVIERLGKYGMQFSWVKLSLFVKSSMTPQVLLNILIYLFTVLVYLPNCLARYRAMARLWPNTLPSTSNNGRLPNGVAVKKRKQTL